MLHRIHDVSHVSGTVSISVKYVVEADALGITALWLIFLRELCYSVYSGDASMTSIYSELSPSRLINTKIGGVGEATRPPFSLSQP